MNYLKFLGFALIVVLVGWITLVVVLGYGATETPNVIGLGNGFEGDLKLPAQQINAAFEDARTEMLVRADRAGWFKFASDVAGWLSFLATALITLIAGYFGRSPAPAGQPVETEGLPARSVRLIGFLAALAAVLTAASGVSSTRAADGFKGAYSLRDEIVKARTQVKDAADATSAQAVIDNLAIKVKE